MTEGPYDALLVVSFGGPEGQDEVIPFLENVLRGRNVPPERMEQVAGHYRRFGGVSPINGQNRALIAAVREELSASGLDLPVYWGNRNWHPLLADTVARMADDGVRRALAFVTSAYASSSGCGQYLDDLARARAEVGADAPAIDKLRLFYNHPGFVGPNADALRRALNQAGGSAHVAFSAHSIPLAMAATSSYVHQLNQTARLVAERGDRRSGPAVAARLPEPKRASRSALARTGYRRPPAGARPERRRRRGGGADRFHLRPHGSGLRPRRRSQGPGRPARHTPHPSGDRGDRSRLRHHDPTAGGGASGPFGSQARPRKRRPVAGPMPPRMLSAPGAGHPLTANPAPRPLAAVSSP